MKNATKKFIESQAISAFNTAATNGYVNSNSSKKEVEENAYEILEYMPDADVDELNDEAFDYAVSVLVEQLY